ncbi:MAG TPA: hypothetical protein VFE97_17405 [Methylomirabilota bacterium]|nr:hypothetical protein [Methylomirabilota bacterium]
MTRIIATIVCVIGVFAACASPTWVYEKRGATPAKLDHDMGLCRKEAHDPQTIALPGSPRTDRELFNRCMERKGYTVRSDKPS